MTERALLPQFIREALEEGPQRGETAELAEPAALRTLLSLESALSSADIAGAEVATATQPPAAREGAGGLARLEATLSEPPHRYAPFFASAAELFDLPESDVIAQLARLK